MPARPDVPSVIRFGPYEADLHSGELRRNGMTVRIQQKPFQLLTVLLENPGRLVAREELRRRLWPADTFVDFDNSLNTAITKLREALGDPAEEHRFIETLARRGYGSGPVEELGQSPATPPAALRLVPLSNERVETSAVDNENAELESGLDRRSDLKPADRFPWRRIRRSWLIAALTLAAACVLVWSLTKKKTPNATEFRQHSTIAVLPFQNATKDTNLDYLSTALPDEVITTLSYAPTLNIRPFSTSQQYSAQGLNPDEAGQRMRASQVVTGRFRRLGDRVAVTLEATDVAKDEIVWHGSIDVTSQDM